MASNRPTTSLIPANYLPYLANAVAAIAMIPTAIGLTSVINPALALEQLKMEPKVDKQLAYGLTRLVGSRNLAIGISTLALWYANRQNQATYRTLGACFLPFAFFLTTDGWVVKEIVGEGEWGHWGFVPIVTALGLGLMGVM